MKNEASEVVKWLPKILKEAGITVIEEPEWETHMHGELSQIRGVIIHHTAGPQQGNIPSLWTAKNGTQRLKGPLYNILVARNGIFHLISPGRTYHAGKGSWTNRKRGTINTGNQSMLGIAGENTGLTSDMPWPDIQMEKLQVGVRAILDYLDLNADDCCGHKEYALPLGRKIDPLFDMDDFRKAIAEPIEPITGIPASFGPLTQADFEEAKPGKFVPVDEIPKVRPGTSVINPPEIERGDTGYVVEYLQYKLLEKDGMFGPKTEAVVQQFQLSAGITATGKVDEQTWRALLKK